MTRVGTRARLSVIPAKPRPVPLLSSRRPPTTTSFFDGRQSRPRTPDRRQSRPSPTYVRRASGWRGKKTPTMAHPSSSPSLSSTSVQTPERSVLGASRPVHPKHMNKRVGVDLAGILGGGRMASTEGGVWGRVSPP